MTVSCRDTAARTLACRLSLEFAIHAAVTDTRTPCPPWGYSRDCDLPEARQVELVAEFHAHRVRPTRIAYRLGIDIALIDALLAGEREPERFEALVRHFRRQRFNDRVRSADRLRGQRAFEARERASQDFEREVGI